VSADPLVTIVIPNWNTGPLLRICLASLGRFTRTPHRVVVVDNASDDASRVTAEGAAEQGLIDLITREDAKNEGAPDHGAALDAGLAATKTPFLLTLDSDAWARREGWLTSFVEALGDKASHAGARKFPGGKIKQFWDRVRGRPDRPEASYVRPCHAIYRMAPLVDNGLSFMPHQRPDGRWQTTGERLHERLVELGHEPIFMPHAEVERLVGHLRHATFVINAEQFPTLRQRAKARGEEQIRAWLESNEATSILEGSSIP
jgi:glycosyltransferase involved in cell wall biosynthesis